MSSDLKVRLTTTLRLLKEHEACEDGYEPLIDYLGHDYPEDKEINLLTILESNGVRHCLWAFRATAEDCSQVDRLIAADCAESVLHIYQEKYPYDDRLAKSIQAARDYANGLIDKQALEETRVAADAAANAAVYAAYAAAYDAAYDAARAARAADAAFHAADTDTAADAAVRAADAAAARAATHAAAVRVAYAYADAAVRAADAACNNEREKQAEIIRKYLIQ